MIRLVLSARALRWGVLAATLVAVGCDPNPGGPTFTGTPTDEQEAPTPGKSKRKAKAPMQLRGAAD